MTCRNSPSTPRRAPRPDVSKESLWRTAPLPQSYVRRVRKKAQKERSRHAGGWKKQARARKGRSPVTVHAALRKVSQSTRSTQSLPAAGLRKVWKIDDSQTVCKTPQEHPQNI